MKIITTRTDKNGNNYGVAVINDKVVCFSLKGIEEPHILEGAESVQSDTDLANSYVVERQQQLPDGRIVTWIRFTKPIDLKVYPPINELFRIQKIQ